MFLFLNLDSIFRFLGLIVEVYFHIRRFFDWLWLTNSLFSSIHRFLDQKMIFLTHTLKFLIACRCLQMLQSQPFFALNFLTHFAIFDSSIRHYLILILFLWEFDSIDLFLETLEKFYFHIRKLFLQLQLILWFFFSNHHYLELLKWFAVNKSKLFVSIPEQWLSTYHLFSCGEDHFLG